MSKYKQAKSVGQPIDEHRLVMERQLGRVLQTVEHVHHKNGDRFDNRIENLEVVDADEHVRIHQQKHPSIKKCAICGLEYTPPVKHRARSQTCSPECRFLLIGIHRRKVTPEKVKEILWMRNQGCTFKEIGDAMGITATRACEIMKGRHIKTLKWHTES